MRQLAPETIGVFLVLAPWLLAGATVETSTAIAVCASLSLLVIALVRGLEGSSLPRPTVFPVFVVGLVWTALQLVPWPVALTRLVAPKVAETARLAYFAAGLPVPRFVPLSLDPGGTLRELINAAALLATVVAVYALRVRRGRTHVLKYVVASVIAVAVLTIAHQAVGATAVFGIYQPVYGTALGPIVNPNQLAGFTALGIPLVLGFAAEARERGIRAAWTATALFLFVFALLTRSRGGAAAAIVGPILFAILLAFFGPRRGRATSPFAARAPLALAIGLLFVACALGAFLYVVGGELPTDFHDTDISKLELAKGGLALALEHPLVGVGRGAFSAAFAALEGSSERYTHPENIVAQWTSEWGFPIALLIAAGLARSLVRAVTAVRSRVHLGAVAGVVSITLQNMVDFSLEMVGIACVAAGVLAALEPSRSPREREDDADAGASFLAPRDRALVALVLAIVMLTPLAVHVDAERMVRSFRDSASVPRETLVARGRATARFHPSEPSLFLLLGAHGVAAGYPYAMRCLNRVMELAPGWASPHVIAAAWFLRHANDDQARLEVREAETRAPGSSRGMACALIARHSDEDSIFRMAPLPDAARVGFLSTIVSCPGVTPLVGESIDAMLLRSARPPTAVLLREASRRLANRDATGAYALAERLVRLDPHGHDGYVVLARALSLRGESARALRALRDAEGRVPDPHALLAFEAELAATLGDESTMRDAVERLRVFDAGSGPAQARALMLLGQLEARLGNKGKALTAFRDADALDPRGGGLVAAAQVADSMGQTVIAAQLYGVACGRAEASDGACRARDALRDRIREAAQVPTALSP